MNPQPLLNGLPLALQTIWRKTEKPYVCISAELARSPLPSARSKFGGVPYMPQGSAYPECRGEPLYLLAQINFADVRRAVGSLVSVGNAVLPDAGILQIFIAGDDLYGLDFDHPYPQHGGTYQVRFYEHDHLPEDAAVAAQARRVFESLFHREAPQAQLPDGQSSGGVFGFVKSLFQQPPRPSVAACGLQTAGEVLLPLYGEYALHFERGSAGLTPSDEVEGRRWFGEEGFFSYCEELAAADGMEAEQICDSFEQTVPMFGHQLFGYPSFTQFDVRDARSKEVLLLQIGSEWRGNGSPFEIMWGDAGIGNFFIAPEDLAAKRFDRLRYNWDCF